MIREWRKANHYSLITVHQLYASGLVFGRPSTFWPSLNCPRFLRSSTRSKRFRTFRFAVIVLAPLRLRCCDIKCSCSDPEMGPQRYSFRSRAQALKSLEVAIRSELASALGVTITFSSHDGD